MTPQDAENVDRRFSIYLGMFIERALEQFKRHNDEIYYHQNNVKQLLKKLQANFKTVETAIACKDRKVVKAFLLTLASTSAMLLRAIEENEQTEDFPDIGDFIPVTDIDLTVRSAVPSEIPEKEIKDFMAFEGVSTSREDICVLAYDVPKQVLTVKLKSKIIGLTIPSSKRDYIHFSYLDKKGLRKLVQYLIQPILED